MTTESRERGFGDGPDALALSTICGVVGRHATSDVGVIDLDADLRADLGITGRHRFELAGELAEIASLPGETDDALNVAIIEVLVEAATVRDIAARLALAAAAA